MAKDKKTQPIVGTTVAIPAIGILPGEEISINLNKQITNLRIQDLGVLTVTDPYITVPQDASNNLLARLDRLLREGFILKGRVDTALVKDKTVLEFYLKAVDLRSLAQMREYIIGLTKTRTRISGWKPKEILESMRAKEAKGSNRRDVIDFLNGAIRTTGEPSLANVPFNKELHTKSRTVLKRTPTK